MLAWLGSFFSVVKSISHEKSTVPQGAPGVIAPYHSARFSGAPG